MDAKPPHPFDRDFRGKVGEILERPQELRPAIGIAGVVVDIRPDENVERPDRFREAKGQPEQDRVAGRHIGHRNSGADLVVAAVLRNFDHVGQGRPADGAQINLYHTMFGRSERFSDLRGTIEFDAMALPVIDAQRMHDESLHLRDRQNCGTVESAAQ